MKVRLVLITMIVVLLAQSAPAQAGHSYWKHKHHGTVHYHKKKHKKVRKHRMSQRAYVRHLNKKYSKVYRPSRGYTRKEFNRLLKLSGWRKKHWAKVYRVSTCESHRRWSTGRGSYVGLMQHRPGNAGMTRKQLENPVLNLIAAKWMYKKRGWGPWPVCGRR